MPVAQVEHYSVAFKKLRHLMGAFQFKNSIYSSLYVIIRSIIYNWQKVLETSSRLPAFFAVYVIVLVL